MNLGCFGKHDKTSHIVLLQIDTLHCQQKELLHIGGQGKSIICVLHVLQLAKRHFLGRSDIDKACLGMK